MVIPKTVALFEVKFQNMEIGQFVWSGQTVVLQERDE